MAAARRDDGEVHMRRFLWLMALLGACTGADTGTDTDVEDTDVEDTGSDTRVGWVVEPLLDLPLGVRPRLEAVPDGLVGVSFETLPETRGTCGDGTPRQHTPLHLLRFDGVGWTSEEIAAPASPFGPLGAALGVDSDGEPWVAWVDGEPIDFWCGGHDLVLRGPDGRTEVAVEESGQAATGEPASDAGSVVGLWPDLAFDPDGAPIVAYRDAHFGALQRDDRFRSDLELVRGGGGFTHEAVDAGAGAGDHNQVVVDASGRVVVATILPVVKQGEDRQGVWVARETDDGWERHRVVAGEVGTDLSLVALPDGGLALAVWIPLEGSAVLYRWDGGAWSDWSRTFLARDGWREGESADLAVLPDGRLVAAFHTCGRLADDPDNCDLADQGPSLAVEEAGGGFRVERIHQEGLASCGREVALASSGGIPHTIFRCTVDVEGALQDRLLHAFREAAP